MTNNRNPTSRRRFVKLASAPVTLLATSSTKFNVARTTRQAGGATLRLATVRDDVLAYFETLRDKEGPYGCYRAGRGQRTDLYASLDVAIARHIMCEDLPRSLTARQRQEWVEHINSYQNVCHNRSDGSYADTLRHSSLHANGMVVGALGALGGRQKHPVHLYEPFDTVEEVAPWLESVDWKNQWRASHLFWGGMVCFSFSRRSSPAWLDRVIRWLNANLDERTGWWRRGVPHTDRHQPLGGSVHILPIYEHHKRSFPYPERVIDSVLALQLDSGRWLETPNINVMHYLELDALYALYLMGKSVPRYRRDDIAQAVDKYSLLVLSYYTQKRDELFKLHPHWVLAAVGTFGLLHRLNPQVFQSDAHWTDIFSDFALHNTKAVEA